MDLTVRERERGVKLEMVGCSRHGLPKWIAAATRVDLDGASSSPGSPKSDASSSSLRSSSSSSSSSPQLRSSSPDPSTGFGERALSAAGAAVLSAVLVNPLDVAKVTLGFFFSAMFFVILCQLAFDVVSFSSLQLHLTSFISGSFEIEFLVQKKKKKGSFLLVVSGS